MTSSVPAPAPRELSKPWRRLAEPRAGCLTTYQLGKKRGPFPTTVSTLCSPIETSDELLRRRALGLKTPEPHVVRALADSEGVSVVEWLEGAETDFQVVPLQRWQDAGGNSFARIGIYLWAWNTEVFLECTLRGEGSLAEVERAAQMLLSGEESG